jgi:hypothetical protein
MVRKGGGNVGQDLMAIGHHARKSRYFALFDSGTRQRSKAEAQTGHGTGAVQNVGGHEGTVSSDHIKEKFTMLASVDSGFGKAPLGAPCL